MIQYFNGVNFPSRCTWTTPSPLKKDNNQYHPFFSQRLVNLSSLHPLFMSQWGAPCCLDVNVNMTSELSIKIYKQQGIVLWFCVTVRSTSVLCEVCFQFELKVMRKDHRGLAAGTIDDYQFRDFSDNGGTQIEKIIPLGRCTIKF